MHRTRIGQSSARLQRGHLHYVNLGLGKRAALTCADTYETEGMDALEDASCRERIDAERTALMRNLDEASNLGLQLAGDSGRGRARDRITAGLD